MGFITGKERQCADSTVHFLHESSSSRELGSSQVPNVCSFSFSLSLSLFFFFHNNDVQAVTRVFTSPRYMTTFNINSFSKNIKASACT